MGRGLVVSEKKSCFSSKEKRKKGVSVKKFPVFIEIEGASPSKFQITKELFAESRQQRSYGSDFAALEAESRSGAEFEA